MFFNCIDHLEEIIEFVPINEVFYIVKKISIIFKEFLRKLLNFNTQIMQIYNFEHKINT